jgi:NPCBM/NEW2 domain
MKQSRDQLLLLFCYAATVAPLLPVAVSRAQSTALAFSVSEPAFPAQLASIDREWNVSFRTEGKVRVVAATDLAYWGRYRDFEGGPQMILADGGVVRADLLLLEPQQLLIGDATGLGRGFWDESALPREAVRGIMLQPPAAAADRDRMLKQLLAHEEADDRLLLTGGESISGTLVSAPAGGRFAAEDAKPGSEIFRLVRRGGTEPLVVPAGKVVAVRFGSAGAERAGDSQPACWLGLSDGSLVRARSVSVKGDIASIGLAAGGELKATLVGRDDPQRRFWDAVTYVEPAPSRLTWLSDMRPLGYKHIPFLSVQRPYQSDQCVLGSRLRADGAVFRKGIGMPSTSRLAYDVAGYRRLEAEIGVDAEAGLSGSVVFKVLLETQAGQWKAAYESPVVRGGDGPIPVSVELKNAGRMALLIDFAERGDECDYADWLYARLGK